MNTELYHAAQQVEAGADPAWRAQMYAWATEPPTGERLALLLRRGLLVVAALLLGAGLIFWIAANWQEQSRGFKLGLIEAALVAALAAACLLPRGRTAALLCATLVLGGLLAFIGQTYQTGADAWQLFAAWAGLALLWVLVQRSDLLWTLWVAIAALALSLWTGPIGLLHWFLRDQHQPGVEALTMLAWLALALLPIAVACLPLLRLRARDGTGLGRWSHRLAQGLALATWSGLAITGMFDSDGFSTSWPVAAVLVASMLWLDLRSRWRDLPSLGLAVLAANVLVLSLATRLLFDARFDVGALLLLGLLGMGCLGGSASWLLRQQRTWSQGART